MKGNGLYIEHLPKCQVSVTDVKLWFLTLSSRQQGGSCQQLQDDAKSYSEAVVAQIGSSFPRKSSHDTESWKVCHCFNGPVGNVNSRAASCLNVSPLCTRGYSQPSLTGPGLRTGWSSPVPLQVPHGKVGSVRDSWEGQAMLRTDHTMQSCFVAPNRLTLHSAVW